MRIRLPFLCCLLIGFNVVSARAQAMEVVDGIRLPAGKKVEQVTDLSVPVLGGGSFSLTRSYQRWGGSGDMGPDWDLSLPSGAIRPTFGECAQSLREKPAAPLNIDSKYFPLFVDDDLGSITDPCPNYPQTSRKDTFCSADGRQVFSNCGWHPVKGRPGQTCVELRLGRGEAGIFCKPASVEVGTYISAPGWTEVLSDVVGGGWELVSQDGSKKLFNAAGEMTGWADRHGLTTSISFNDLGGGATQRVLALPGGRQVTLNYQDGLINSIVDPANRTFSYAYDANRRLIDVYGPGANTDDPNSGYHAHYAYDLSGRMLTKDDARSTGFKRASYNYDLEGKVQSVLDGIGRVRGSFRYASGSVQVTLGRGQAWNYVFDDKGLLTRATDPLGTVYAQAFDDHGNLKQRDITPGDGGAVRTWKMTYDDRKNMRTRLDPEQHLESWEFIDGVTPCGCDRFAASHTDKRSHTTTQSYNAFGDVTATTDALGYETLHFYDNQGQRQRSVDARGHETTYSYFANGDLESVHSPAGTVTYVTDALGRVTDVTDELGHHTHYQLDGLGNALVTTYADNSYVQSTYDAHGNLTEQGLQASSSPSGSMRYRYDAADQLLEQKDAEEQATQFDYDEDGNRKTVTDPLGAVWSSTYDVLNRLKVQLDPELNETQYRYDAFGNRKTVIDAEGNATAYEYDKMDRLRFVTDARGARIEFRYDNNGNRRFMIDARGKQTEWRYDERDLLTKEIDALGVTVKSYAYDENGNVETLTDGNGTETAYTYDDADRLVAEDPSTGDGYEYHYGAPGQEGVGFNLASVEDARGIESFLYDSLDRLQTHAKPSGEVLVHEYDERGNRTKTTLQFRPSSGLNEKSLSWAYDRADRNFKATDWLARDKGLTYDRASRLVLEKLPAKNVTSTYAYDKANRLLGLYNKDRFGSHISLSVYELDRVGNRRSKETALGVEKYSYDKTYQLTGVRYPVADIVPSASTLVDAGLTKTVAISYDLMGNRTGYSETYTGGLPALNKGYAHDDANAMTSDHGVGQIFDQNGNLTQRGNETLGWDHRNRLIAVTEPGKDDWAAKYDYNNRIAEKTLDGTPTTFIYDDLGRLLAELNADGSYKRLYMVDAIGVYGHVSKSDNGTEKPTYYLFDGLGSVVTTIDTQGQTIDNFKYGAWGEVVGENSAADATPFGFTGRWGGYRDGRLRRVLNWKRWYGSGSARWHSRDPKGVEGGHNLYTYGVNAPTLQYDPNGESPFDSNKDWCGSDGTEYVPDGIPGDEGLFKKACHAHDDCYGTCNLDATSSRAAGFAHQRTCDKALGKDMQKACAEKFRFQPYDRWRCQNMGRIYDKVLMVLGRKAYMAAQRNCENERCHAK